MEKIFIIEDDVNSLDVIARILEANHYQVMSARNGSEGFNKIKSFKPDCVLLDVVDSNQITLDLKQDEELNKVPVIIFTTFAIQGDKKDAMDVKAKGFIEKPVNPELFLSQFKSILGKI